MDEVKCELKKLIELKTSELSALKSQLELLENKPETEPQNGKATVLTNQEILRYSRQLILPEIGTEGQLKLKNSCVLVVGCGGLGCPVAIYLAATGVGKIGLVDHDVVELTNLHRQVLHNMDMINEKKCHSLAVSCSRLNSDIEVKEHFLLLNSSNAMEIMKDYDIVVDATDNPATRYLLNDACVLLGKPLVSGSVLRFEGQLTVYNYKDSPCYRCLHPVPPKLVVNCSDGGVLGAVVGVIGTLQAVETVKIIIGMEPSYAKKMFLFDAISGSTKMVKLRGKQSSCEVCSEHPTVTKLIDYELFCGSSPTDKDKSLKVLKPEERISVLEYKEMLDKNEKHILVDVREPVEIGICKLPVEAINLRMRAIGKPETKEFIEDQLQKYSTRKIIVLCRRGNHSQLAVEKLKTLLDNPELEIFDVAGGLYDWKEFIDVDFPKY